MVKSLVSKLSSASSNLSLASTLSSVGGGGGHGSGVQETNYAKHRNDPGRFFGDGVQFKAKLIGILEVGEARGDRMCQEALQDLKMAIRAAGEHKQRITIHVTIDGLRLRDEKTGDSLYHHPVHKISFIAQDMTDSRAFGYIFGSPDSGHRFFGIKTDKAASQVVLAMRDLFQVVFELKKKEIELARQQIQSKSIHEHQLASLSSLKSSGAHNDLGSSSSTGGGTLSMLGSMGQGTSSISRLGVNLDTKGAAKEMSPESVADLVDLEQELSSIQRGITQMERITPSEPVQPNMASASTSSGKTTNDDPFGDSFTNFPTYNLLPPPESGRSRHKPSKPAETSATISSLLSPAAAPGGSPVTLQHQDDDDSWLHELDQQPDVFDTSKTGVMGMNVGLPMAPLAPSESTSTPTQQLSESSALADVEMSASSGVMGSFSNVNANTNANANIVSLPSVVSTGVANTTTTTSEPTTSGAAAKAVSSDAFTDLDPLGTGRTRPYVDKKYFFQELKNPPKKVLKDLSATSGSNNGAVDMSGSYTTAAAVVDEFLSKEGLFDDNIKAALEHASSSTATAPIISTLTMTGERQQTQPQSQSQQLQFHHYHQQPLNVTNTNNNNNNNSNSTTEPTAVVATTTSTGDPVMLPRDTDPFSPTRKKSDPFQEGDIFGKLDPFEFEFPAKTEVATAAPRASPTVSSSGGVPEVRRSADVFNGPLQVSLPPEPESLQWKADISRLERRQSSGSPSGTMMANNTAVSATTTTTGSTARARPTPSGQFGMTSASSASSSVLKQQTVDVISSISNKKMPHLFGQARFSKRDSNSINMRRLQESDSLSENEAAPEPPPRPDSASHIEPPPLPPKKQFNEIVIRPRATSGSVALSSAAATSINRYEFLNAPAPTKTSAAASDVPPIPLPSRRVGRSDGTYPGPGRPRKPGHMEDDYLAPISSSAASSAGSASDVPPLLPPPTQTSTRTRAAQRQQSFSSKTPELYENKAEIQQQQQQQQQQQPAPNDQEPPVSAVIPDITLSQLLTLGIDDLALKLNVPTSKLTTMTLVELTSYLSEFIEKSNAADTQKVPSPVPAEKPPTSSVFKVNFDQQATFVANFDDTFGEDVPATQQDTFVANFAQFNESPVAPVASGSNRTPAVPPADRYAVFREIIDQELQHQREDTDLIGDLIPVDDVECHSATSGTNQMTAENSHFEARFDDDDDFLTAPPREHTQRPPKIDTKITEVVAQAKDRYAALRDIILVENLFEKQPPTVPLREERDLMQQDFPEFSDEFNEDQDLKQIMDSTRVSSAAGLDRLGLVDSRGFPAEPSSSAFTIEDDDEEYEDGGAESSLDSNDKDGDAAQCAAQDKYEKLSTSNQQLDMDKCDKLESNGICEGVGQAHSETGSMVSSAKQDSKFLTVAGASGLSASKDDLEIDELMQRAISNLSLDSRERISPANSTALPRPAANNTTLSAQSQFNDVSTSPIPLQKSPAPSTSQKSPLSKSPQPSPILSQLSAVSNLIDNATKQMSSSNLLTDSELSSAAPKASKESWATFDSPRPAMTEVTAAGAAEKRARPHHNKSGKATSLHLPPPPPPSNTSQNDTAESPCSSDPRDDGGWNKGVSGRRWAKKERHHTSSSSRDLSPWDDETPDYLKQKQRMGPGVAQSGQAHPVHPDRHGYYMRHARRMNSCDEDYDYEEDFSSRRDHRKFKQGLSRSRDNFDLDSPSWYHHASHHTWSPQDVEQSAAMRGRSFERSAYERQTYGPPIYDKRGVPVLPPPGSSSYDRRGGYDKRKYYRDYSRPNYDYDEYGESPQMQDRYRETGSFEKLKLGRRSDYENIYDDGRSPMGGGVYKGRVADYMYERDRKSFDRESVESFESATRRRRSFGSGDVYGSLESREEFRDRYMGGGGAEKTRSLRKGMKMRPAGDIDYEQDSENDFHQRGRVALPVDSRSLQRPSQLSGSTVVGGGGVTSAQTRMRKSSGSSPWDGEEPPLPGQKSWKRPSSAADSERRLAESRRAAALGQTPSGSDGEKDRRFRKKQRGRGKEIPPNSVVAAVPPQPPTSTSGGRYGPPLGSALHPRDNYDYITYDDDDDDEDIDDGADYPDEDYDEPPTDEDKFERLNRRRHEMHQRMLESERSRQAHAPGSKSAKVPSAATTVADAKRYHGGRVDYDFDDYEQSPTPRSSNTSNAGPSGNKFQFDAGFESDFNQSSPPPAPVGTASSCTSTPAATISSNVTPATKSSFRFSNDFSERDKMSASSVPYTNAALQQFDLDAAVTTPPLVTPPITQKLRFDDNVKVSQFDDAAFEDDFSNAQFDFEKEDQWHAESLQASSNAAAKKHSLRNSKLQQRQELIKKSESVNIFAKKSEDPFEDDEFFKAPSDDKAGTDNGQAGATTSAGGSTFQWDDDSNFAKFDENM